ncbi:MAG: MarR family transcriptional regulator [Piscirickettsiaceae bacterium]|nr:MAG: MarR family transcriptional regulator [Piscirickettsiaceae bacterium]PCH85585.1 MAG: MarR family transcriptional regulator [Piscirickettsiaceae bacterium]
MGPVLDNQVCYALYSTSGLVTQAYRSLLGPLKLTYPQFAVMMALWQKDNISVTELAKTVGLSKPTMTPLLKRLELLGYITREFEPDNDRQKNIALTRLGHSLAPSAEDVAQQALCATNLTDQEANLLISLCHKVKKSLK